MICSTVFICLLHVNLVSCKQIWSGLAGQWEQVTWLFGNAVGGELFQLNSWLPEKLRYVRADNSFQYWIYSWHRWKFGLDIRTGIAIQINRNGFQCITEVSQDM